MIRCPRLSWLLSLCLLLSAAYAAEPKKEKPPGEAAADAFIALRNKDEPMTPQRMNQVITAGLTYLKTYAMHPRAIGVMNSLASFGTKMEDKKMAPQRIAYLSTLQYEILRQGGEAKHEQAPTALKALAAAAAGQAFIEAPSRDKLLEFREKLDSLAEMPESGHYQPGLERQYVSFLKQTNNLPMAEAHLTRLQQSADKRVSDMARAEMKLLSLAKQPLELSFTATNGKTVNLADLRGQLVFFIFWASTNEASVQELRTIQEAEANNRWKKIQIIAVCYDNEENKAAAEKVLKRERIKWPVWFSGRDNELGEKLGVTKLPDTALFDERGIYLASGIHGPKVNLQVERLKNSK